MNVDHGRASLPSRGNGRRSWDAFLHEIAAAIHRYESLDPVVKRRIRLFTLLAAALGAAGILFLVL